MRRITVEEALTELLEPELLREYPVLWWDQRMGVCGLHRLMYHWTVHIGISYIGYGDRYCYQTREMAEQSMDAWTDTTEDPPGDWHKHPRTSRRRNPATGRIWFEWEVRDAEGNEIQPRSGEGDPGVP